MKHIVINFVGPAVFNQRGGGGLLCENNAIYAANVSSDVLIVPAYDRLPGSPVPPWAKW